MHRYFNSKTLICLLGAHACYSNRNLPLAVLLEEYLTAPRSANLGLSGGEAPVMRDRTGRKRTTRRGFVAPTLNFIHPDMKDSDGWLWFHVPVHESGAGNVCAARVLFICLFCARNSCHGIRGMALCRGKAVWHRRQADMWAVAKFARGMCARNFCFHYFFFVIARAKH